VEGDAFIPGTIYAHDVRGLSPLKLYANSITSIFIDNTTGFVGVGKENPTVMLDVNGSVNALGVFVNGTSVCLSNGTNCQASGSADSPWTNNSRQVYLKNEMPQLVNVTGLIVNGSNPSIYMKTSRATGAYSTALGYKNNASGAKAFVGGGQQNTASGNLAFIGGGVNNKASGIGASIINGLNNIVSGRYSFAFGRNINIIDDYYAVFFSPTYPGRVGINTEKPSSSLEVHGGNITLTNSTPTEKNYIKFGRGGYMYDNGTALILGHD